MGRRLIGVPARRENIENYFDILEIEHQRTQFKKSEPSRLTEKAFNCELNMKKIIPLACAWSGR